MCIHATGRGVSEGCLYHREEEESDRAKGPIVCNGKTDNARAGCILRRRSHNHPGSDRLCERTSLAADACQSETFERNLELWWLGEFHLPSCNANFITAIFYLPCISYGSQYKFLYRASNNESEPVAKTEHFLRFFSFCPAVFARLFPATIASQKISHDFSKGFTRCIRRVHGSRAKRESQNDSRWLVCTSWN